MFCCVSGCLSVCVALPLCVYVLLRLLRPKPLCIDGKHVIVTGGSSGIGLAVAEEVIRRGANVTLLARNKNRLDEAKAQLEQLIQRRGTSQRVHCVSVDVSGDYDNLEQAIRQAEAFIGPVEMLVNSAGCSVVGTFEDTPLEEFKRTMEINYVGSVYASRAVIGGMKERRSGRVVFVSSQAGQLGVFGYTAYSASKFALRGLAEALQMEVTPYNIRVTVNYPPDTDTPMLRSEINIQPTETRLISETSGLFTADSVARTLVADSLAGRFSSHVGTDGYILSVLTAGMAPVDTALDVLQQVLLMAVFRAVSVFYLLKFDKIVRQCQSERVKETKKQD